MKVEDNLHFFIDETRLDELSDMRFKGPII